MFCINCGTQIADDAAFCINCGSKVNSAPQPVVEAPVVEAPVAEPVVEASAEPVVEPVVYQQPTYQAQPEFQAQPIMQEQPTFQAQPAFQPQPTFQQELNTQVKAVEKKKASKALMPAIILGILSMIISVAISIHFFADKEVGKAIGYIIFTIAALVVAIYAANKSAIISILKGILFTGVAVFFTMYFIIEGTITTKDILSDYFSSSATVTGTDVYFAFVMIALIVFFAIYMIMNIIRSFINSKSTSMLMVVSGYFSALLVTVCFVLHFAAKRPEVFAFKFIPIDLGFVTLILADILATISRSKKFEA